MDLTFIILLVVAVVFIALFFMLIKNIVKVILYSVGILLLLVILIGAFYYLDLNKFSKNIFVEDKLFLLEDNNMIVSALSIEELNDSTFLDEYFMADEQLATYTSLYHVDNYEKINEGHDRIFIIKNEEFGLTKDNQAFGKFLEQKLTDEGYLFLLKEYKNGNIIIYPKSLLFKVADINPLTWIGKIKKRFTDA